jgi:putative toxin-antitoxin system antitoxin component (TIGR02293 family)
MTATATTSAFADEVHYLRDLGHLNESQISRAIGVNRSTVGAWLRRQRAPSGVRAERIAELSSIVSRASAVMRPEYIPVWLSKPVPALGFEKPMDLVARGDYRQVAELLGELETGVHS